MSPSLWCETVLSYRLLEVELALNGSIVPACWDAGVLHTLLMDATYVEVEVVLLPMRLGKVSKALMKPNGAWLV